jgi:hypothetical protein
MSNVSWFSKGVKHWQNETRDWLCLRRDLDPTITSIILHEDTHHYFEELHVFDISGQQIAEQSLEGPGPFDIPLDHLDRCIVLAKVSFLPYSKAPFPQVGMVQEVLCGEVIRSSGQEEPILMQITGDPYELKAKPYLRSAHEAFREFFGAPTASPLVELRPGSSQTIPFQMRFRVPFNTKVYLITDQDLDAELSAGEEIDAEKLDKVLPFLVIKAHQNTPQQAQLPSNWTIALPVLQKTKSTGVVGLPLTRSALISKLELDAVGPKIWASWEWLAPRRWLKVQLTWNFYRDGNWAEGRERDSITVTRQLYDRQNCVQLFERAPENRGWHVEVEATPLLLDTPLPGQQLRSRHTL